MVTIVEALAKGKCTKQHHKARWGRQQPWKQKKRTVRKLGWSSMLPTAVRTAAFSLETCYSSSRLASVCPRKNPKLLPSVIETGYLWSSSKLRTALIFSSTPVSSWRLSSASVSTYHKSWPQQALHLMFTGKKTSLKTEHFQWSQGVTDRKSSSLNCNTEST